MTKRSWWKIIVGFLVVLNLVLWASGNLYLYKALIYNYVNIDDLNRCVRGDGLIAHMLTHASSEIENGR